MIYYSLISSPVQAQYFYVKMTMCVWCGFSSGCTLCLGKSFFLFQPPRRGKSHEEHAARKDFRTRTVPQHGWVTFSFTFPPNPPISSSALIQSALFINRVTCLQPNWSPPLSCRRLFYTQEECNSVPSVLLFCAILCLFACLLNM